MKIVLFANTDWYLYNFCGALALRLCALGHQVLLVAPAGSYSMQLQAPGLRWVAAPMQRQSLNPLRELWLLVWLWRLLRRERVDLLHGLTMKCAIYGALTARLAQVAHVSSVSGMGYVFSNRALKARLLRPLVRILLRVALGGAAVRLILQNPDDQRLFTREGLMTPEYVRLIQGSGVDCSRFSPVPAQTAEHPYRVLLAVRVLWDKGIAEFVEAARLVQAAGYSLRFQLAGVPDPGNPAAVPVALLEAWVAEGLIEWLGQIQDMPALLGTVDLMVLPSYREGLPKGLIEAGACALPIITTDVPGCRTVVTHEVDGLLVPVRNASALAEAIIRLAKDPALSQKLGTAARAKVLAQFDERLIIAQTLAVYQELIPVQA